MSTRLGPDETEVCYDYIQIYYEMTVAHKLPPHSTGFNGLFRLSKASATGCLRTQETGTQMSPMTISEKSEANS